MQLSIVVKTRLLIAMETWLSIVVETRLLIVVETRLLIVKTRPSLRCGSWDVKVALGALRRECRRHLGRVSGLGAKGH